MSNETASLNIEPRTVVGKAVKQLRAEGQVPVVIHDHGKESVLAQAEYLELAKLIKKVGKHSPVELKGAAKAYTALVKDAEFDPKKNMLRHVVFNAVSATQKVDAEVPVSPQYAEGNESSPAERSGLIVLAQAETVMIEAVASKLPEVLYYDAEKLVEVGDSVTAEALILPEGVIVKTDASQALATVYEPSAMAAANDAAGGDAEEEAPAAEVASEDGKPVEEAAAEKSAE